MSLARLRRNPYDKGYSSVRPTNARPAETCGARVRQREPAGTVTDRGQQRGVNTGREHPIHEGAISSTTSTRLAAGSMGTGPCGMRYVPPRQRSGRRPLRLAVSRLRLPDTINDAVGCAMKHCCAGPRIRHGMRGGSVTGTEHPSDLACWLKIIRADRRAMFKAAASAQCAVGLLRRCRIFVHMFYGGARTFRCTPPVPAIHGARPWSGQGFDRGGRRSCCRGITRAALTGTPTLARNSHARNQPMPGRSASTRSIWLAVT
jgi:hypothetical protein